MKRDWYWNAFRSSRDNCMSMKTFISLVRQVKEGKMMRRTMRKQGKTYEGDPVDVLGGRRKAIPVISKRTGKVFHYRMVKKDD